MSPLYRFDPTDHQAQMSVRNPYRVLIIQSGREHLEAVVYSELGGIRIKQGNQSF